MSKLENEQKRELARMYYLQGTKQKEIADKVGVSRNTISTWIKEEGWDSFRAAKTITRKEIVHKMLQQINDKLESKDWTADEIVKASSAIEKLDKQTNVVTVIEVFTAYNTWLVGRMQVDKELTPELVKVMNRYQDLFIGEQLGKVNVIQVD